MRFEALGPLVVISDEGPVQLRPAHRRLLASLLLNPDAPVPTDTLIERMWGESAPATAHNTLHVHLSVVRKLVPEVIRAEASGYMAEINGHGFDVADFTTMSARAASRLAEGRFREAGDLAQRAAKLWRGDAFPELADVDIARGERQRLIEMLTGTHLTLAKALTLQGRMSESIGVLKHLVVEHPFNESLWEELILAYYLAGRQADALRAFGEASQILGDELGIEPGPRLRELEEKVLLHDPRLMEETVDEVPNNLPVLDSSFVGRSEDITGVASLLERNHLATITGGPGVGKTRLAIETARASFSDYPGGIWLVRLAGARTAAEVAATVAATLGVKQMSDDLPDLFEHLSPRPSLIILDNCEHLLEAVRSCVGVRLHGTRLRVLATSRTRLGANDEAVWRLRPLTLPESADGMWESPAMTLLADRVNAADPRLDLRELDQVGLVDVCRRTGGIPLALELTASRMPSLDLESVADLTLAPAAVDSDLSHHSSVSEAVAWSVTLLDDGDRKAFETASVFASTFTSDGFHQVCLPRSDADVVASVVGRLVEASLLTSERTSSGQVRYRMLEPLREFASARISRKALRAALDRHATWHVSAARSMARAENTGDDATALAEVDMGVADYRVAIRHLLATDRAGDAVVISAGIMTYWMSRYLSWEGLAWLEECLDAQLDDFSRLVALGSASYLSYFSGDADRSVSYADAALDVASRIDHLEGQAHALAAGGFALAQSGGRQEGFARLEKAIAIYDELGATVKGAIPRLNLGLVASESGATDMAIQYLNEAIEGFGTQPSLRMVALAHRCLSLIAWQGGDERTAREHMAIAIDLAERSNDERILGIVMAQQGVIEATWGNPALGAGCLIAALESVEGLPPGFFAERSFWAVPLLARVEEWSLVIRLLDHIDAIYTEANWTAVEDRHVVAVGFRDRAAKALGAHPDPAPVPTSAMFAELLDTLGRIQEHNPTG